MRSALFSLTLFSLSATAHAVVIAYDGFDSYGANSNLNNGSGGTGWAGNWNALGNHTTAQAGALTDPTGNVNGGSQTARLQPTTNLGDQGAFLQRSFAAQTGTVYVSFLIERGAGVDSGDFYNFMVSNGNTGNTQNAMGIGFRNSGNNPLFARAGSSSGGSTDNGPTTTADTTYLVVARFWKDGSSNYNRVDLFLNPADASAESGTITASATSDTGIDTLSLFNIRNFGPESGDTVFLDELHIGTTFADVIPEPSTVLLGAFGSLFFLRRRR